MTAPLDARADTVPSVGGGDELTLVDGRTFAVSDRSGDMRAGVHGMVHDDLRHVSSLSVRIREGELQRLAGYCATPLSAVVVSRLTDPDDGHPTTCMLVRRRWLAGGMRDDIELRESGPASREVTLELSIGADFAHVFDVKEGRRNEPGDMEWSGDRLAIFDRSDDSVQTLISWEPPPDFVDVTTGKVAWRLSVPGHSTVRVTWVVEPVVGDDPVDLSLLADPPPHAVPLRRIDGWRTRIPTVVSTDPRIAPAVDQAIADLAALRIIDRAHPERAITAAGAPWFMTLFGRDSLITALMTLGFDPDLAGGVLRTLADLQGVVDDPLSEEQPGKILHELRRRRAGGPFQTRGRYYGTVDATALFVMLAAEARRWGALGEDDVHLLAGPIDAAVDWLETQCDTHGDGWVTYQRRHPSGLSNQGWKDSWDGVNFADGRIAAAPIALVEVQGYAYAAFQGAAELAGTMPLRHDAAVLRARAAALKERFNERYWDHRGWFVLGLDGAGDPIDSLTTNPGHALWCGIADQSLADVFLDRLTERSMWTGWGLRTLSSSMGAFDPLSYHNGSVWPHDTALCAAGAARYGRWDVVDLLCDGLFDTVSHFDGRPPELFAGMDRDDVPVPVSYPSSCSPQAWSSAAMLMSIRSMLGLRPDAHAGLEAARPGRAPIADLEVCGLYTAHGRADVRAASGEISISPSTKSV